jgi:hypothetical protein
LSEKLGIKEGMTIVVVNAPEQYLNALGRLPRNVSITREAKDLSRLIHFFATKKKGLESGFPKLTRQLAPDGALWVSWPKRSSGTETDLNENVVRDVGLENGLVDVKVIAIDETWSGLKFVRRLKDRK